MGIWDCLRNARALSMSPRSNATMPPFPLCCLWPSSYCGWLSKPKYIVGTPRCSSAPAISRAFAETAFILPSRVFNPSMHTNASNPFWMEPTILLVVKRDSQKGIIVRHRHSSKGVSLAIDVLGGGMDHHICSQCQGMLEYWR